MHDSINKRFGEAIQKAREQQKLSLRQLAAQTDGVGHETIFRIEKGETAKLPTAIELCRVLNLKLDDFTELEMVAA